MDQEIEDPVIAKMELDKDKHEEDEKKFTKMKGQSKEVKQKHEKRSYKKKKENSKKAYIQRV